MERKDLDRVRAGVLNQMERADRARRNAIIGAAVVEAILLSAALWLVDWNDRLQLVMFVMFVLTYMVIGAGLIALGAHVSQSAARVVSAIESAAKTT